MSEVRSLLIELGIQAAPASHRHGRSGWVQINCPDCGEGLNKYHLGISERQVKANCWNCGPKNLTDILHRLSDLSFPEIKAALASLLPASREGMEQRAIPKRLKLPAGLGKLLRAHRDYLRGRFFDPRSVRQIWKLQGIGVSTPDHAWRIFIPVIVNGRTVSWTARSIGDDPIRYRSCAEDKEIVPHKSTLFGIDYVSKVAIVHEGPLDVMATGPGAVATFGTSFTPGQIRRLAKLRRLIICYDSSRAAQQRAMALMNYLEPFPVECTNVVIEADDAADALVNNPKELRLLRKLAFGKSR